MPPKRPVVLVILDGVGINPSSEHNALAAARTPSLDALFQGPSYTTLEACGHAVGLPPGQMGNSEVGHTIMGCGSIVMQDLVRIDRSITDGTFGERPSLIQAVDRAAQKGRPLHLVGLVSDGGVHSHIRHLEALISLARSHGVPVRLHMITDGRDVPPHTALEYLEQVLPMLEAADGRIDSVCGRFYAMDRDHRWERTQLAFEAIARAEGVRKDGPRDAIESIYAKGLDDEFIPPCVCAGAALLDRDDTMVFFNFRNDRPRQLAEALAAPMFPHFDRPGYSPVALTTMTPFDPDLDAQTAFDEEMPAITLGQILSDAGIAQLRCAETEKYPHVTFFFNGGREAPWPGEQRIMVPSPDVDTYDQQPEMSARAVADAVVEGMRGERYGFILVNFANGDMVGHTAQFSAAVLALEHLDAEIGRIADAAREHGYALLITADHGNCDQMVDLHGRPHTQHTMHPVPCVVEDREPRRLRTGGGLGNIAPTVLELMEIPKPAQMPQESLLAANSENPPKTLVQPAP